MVPLALGIGDPRADAAALAARPDGAGGHDEGPSPVGAPAPAVTPAPVPAPAQGQWPLSPQPEVVRRFDPPDAPWGAGHRGVDLRGSPGEVVRSALPGKVSFVGVIAGTPVVAVDHGATRTTYEPVVAVVKTGQSVGAGTPIGRLSLAGSHCFPKFCLHWGLIRNADDVYLDPLTLVGGGPKPIRLLPLWRDRPAS
ncbi:MAG: M23 family metallopeptidase [Nocardioides sp.]|nr:M23 family metallopeptidase [Nocardioides sp.]